MDRSSQLFLINQKTMVDPRHEAQVTRLSIADANQVLQQINEDIDKLVDQKEQLSTRITELSERRMRVNRDIARLQIALAPHRLLPEDILSQIFIVCARLYGTVRLPLKKKDPPPQLVLSHVCRTWRRVALVTRELWSDIHITDLDTTPSRNKRIGQRWLSRAGNHAVALSLDLKRTEGAYSSRSVDVLDVLRGFILPCRIRRLQLEGQLSMLSQIPEDVLSSIEELHLNFTIININSIFPDMPTIISKTRSIHLLQSNLDQNQFDQFMQRLSFPLSQLRRFASQIRAISLARWITLFQQTPLLEECSLVITTDPSGEEELVLDNLREFNLKVVHVALDKVIRRLKFPSLRKLVLRDCRCWTTETYGIIQQQYNLGQLEEFVCDGGYPLPISTVLRDAPMLRNLDLFPGSAVIDDEGIIGISTGYLGRFLVSLRINCEEPDVEELLYMVEARLRNVRQLLDDGCSREEEFTALRDVTLSQHSFHQMFSRRVGVLKDAGVEVS